MEEISVTWEQNGHERVKGGFTDWNDAFNYGHELLSIYGVRNVMVTDDGGMDMQVQRDFAFTGVRECAL